MPIYEYACTHCNQHCERMQSIQDPALTQCPNCHSETLVRLISLSGFRLKGEGWWQPPKSTADTKPAGEAPDVSKSEQATEKTTKSATNEPQNNVASKKDS